MKHWTAVIGALVVLGPFSAEAQVTAEEVWQNWQGFAEATGQSYAPGTIQRGDGTLTLRDIRVTTSSPGASIQGSIDEITFRERGDGTVAITASPEYGLSVETIQPGGDTITQQVTVIHDRLDLVASGQPDAINYDFTAVRITLRAEGPTSLDAGSDLQMEISANDISGQYGVNTGTTPTLTTDLKARTLALTLDATESGSDVALELSANDFVAAGESAAGFLADPAGLATLGQGTDTTISYADLRLSIEAGSPGATQTFGTSAETGSVSIRVGDDGIGYGFETTGLTFALSGDGVPLPQISARLASASAEVQGPVLVSDTPDAFVLRIGLDQLELGELIWSSFDPDGLLSRDPARLNLDISGELNWLADIREMGQQSDQPPAALHALQVSDLSLSAGGAELTGSGAFTFDNTDLETFRGMPAPDGSFELQATGANALIDTLITLGLIPAAEAAVARIVAAPFLEAGDGPDTLRTRIEISPEGGIRANGRPVR